MCKYCEKEKKLEEVENFIKSKDLWESYLYF